MSEETTPRVNITNEEAELIIRSRVKWYNEMLRSLTELDASDAIDGNGKIAKRKIELSALKEMLDEIEELFTLTWSHYTFHVARGQV